MFKTVLRESVFEEEEKKSRFIGYLYPIQSPEEALIYIDKIKSMHKDSRHNCYAYIIGQEGTIQKCDDDGEPQKTAGYPILEVLKSAELKNVVCVVTRYFGGTLLGTGGLIRSYSAACAGAIQNNQVVEMREFKKIRLSYGYEFHGSIENYLWQNGFPMEDMEFSDKICVTTYVYKGLEELFMESINDRTSASHELIFSDGMLLPTSKEKLLWKGKLYAQCMK